MNEDEDRWQGLIEGLRAGDGRAERQFWDQYGPALERLAERHVGANLRRRIGPEDVVQSACRTFLRRARGGEFQLADSAAWRRVLCAITLTKVREQARFHLRQKRGLAQEERLEVGSDGSVPGIDPVDPQPPPDEVAAFSEQMERLLGSLDEEERQIVELKLQDLTNEQAAEQMGCSERTVRRILKRVESRFGQLLQGE